MLEWGRVGDVLCVAVCDVGCVGGIVECIGMVVLTWGVWVEGIDVTAVLWRLLKLESENKIPIFLYKCNSGPE